MKAFDRIAWVLAAMTLLTATVAVSTALPAPQSHYLIQGE